MKRLLVFFFYDRDGVVDNYIDYMLNDLTPNFDRVVVVCNGLLDLSGRELFSKYTNEILVRENFGFDAWAYKEGIEYVSWEAASQYDEVVLMNFTVMGPVYPFSEMFNIMDKKDIDFWGIARLNATQNAGWGFEVEEHIISFFTAIRKKMFSSPEFREHFDNLPPITSVHESWYYHEAPLTSKFSKLGYSWCAYADSEELKQLSSCPLIDHSMDVVRDLRSPVVKRKSFFSPNYYYLLGASMGEQSKELYNYMEKDVGYDMNLMWENILRTSDMSTIKDTMQLNYILPSDISYNILQQNTHKIAVIVYLSDNNCYSRFREYISRLDKTHFDFHLIYESNVVVQTLDDFRKDARPVSETENKERFRRDLAVFLSLETLLSGYNYFCVLNFDLIHKADFLTNEYAVIYRGLECLLRSNDLVDNIIRTFEKNSKLGILVPPPPNGRYYYKKYTQEWQDYWSILQRLSEQLNVPFDRYKPAISPYTGMFWGRKEAFTKVFREHNMKELLKDFYPFGRIDYYQPLDCAIGVLIQHTLHYCAWVMSDEHAKIEITNLNFYNRIIKNSSYQAYSSNSIFEIKDIIRLNLKNCSRKDLWKHVVIRTLPDFVVEQIRRIYSWLKKK